MDAMDPGRLSEMDTSVQNWWSCESAHQDNLVRRRSVQCSSLDSTNLHPLPISDLYPSHVQLVSFPLPRSTLKSTSASHISHTISEKSNITKPSAPRPDPQGPPNKPRASPERPPHPPWPRSVLSGTSGSMPLPGLNEPFPTPVDLRGTHLSRATIERLIS